MTLRRNKRAVKSGRTRVQAALVAVGTCQDEAAMAGVTGLREGGRGVDGVAAAQDVGGVQELHVGHCLRRHGGWERNSSGHYGNVFERFNHYNVHCCSFFIDAQDT